MPDIVNGLILYGVFVCSATLHEAAHAWVALRGGDPTAYHGGQVTLNPIPHIRRQPIGMVVLPLISALISGWPIGFASAPYDPQWAQRYPRKAGWMAMAGPGSNLLLVVLVGVLISIGLAAGVFTVPAEVSFGQVTAGTGGVWDAVAHVLGAIFSLNLLLAVLNVMPVPPLDGSAGLLVALPARAIARYQEFQWRYRGFALIGILIAWQLLRLVFFPVFIFVINVLYFFHGVHY